MIPVYHTAEPEQCLNQRIEAFKNCSDAEACFAIEYSFSQYYLPNNPKVVLMALVALRRQVQKTTISAGVLPCTDALRQAIKTVSDCADLSLLVRSHHMAWFDLHGPLLLDPVSIPKPWGREIWFTGIERRGRSLVSSPSGGVELPWLLSLAPQRLVAGRERQLTLLKILDPLAEEIYGDLYVEMHEQKREVYVVTHIDKRAWPSGEGGIRLGFDAGKRETYESDDAFRAAYLEAVKTYEMVRRQVDQFFDDKCVAANTPGDEPIPVAIKKQWQQNLPKALCESEESLRKAMDSFTAVKPLQLGDVVKVPCFTPHSLQHGVRVVEFQTPVYERKILSFAQKVLTQSHWDTAEAIDQLIIDAPPQAPLIVLEQTDGVKVERIVDFDDFEVRRITLASGCKLQLEDEFSYAVLMSVQGAISVAAEHACPLEIGAEQAALLPAHICRAQLTNLEDKTAIILLSIPSAPWTE